ncbi:MAG: hypothetical protein ACRD3D_15810 [Terriglobia bacterium]
MKILSASQSVLLLGVAVIFTPAFLCGASRPQPVIPSGTQIDVKLTTTLSSSANQDGDPFLAEVEQPIFAAGEQIVDAGSTLRGHVTFVKPPGRVKGKAELRLVADSIVTKSGKQYAFKGQLADLTSDNGAKLNASEGTVEGSGKSKKDAAKDTGIGAAAGAGVGAITAGGTGALYGAGIGAVAMAIRTLAKHHKDVVLQAGTDLTFVLTTPGTVTQGSKAAPVSTPFICATCK